MRRIEKRAQEPHALLAYRKMADPNRSYDGFTGKQRLREPLLADQGHLCCYCMRRIDDGTMKIEHFRSQRRAPEEALSWRNLLAACEGGEGRARSHQTCDTRKSDQELTIDPRTDSVRSLRYLANGKIRSCDPLHADDIEHRLNLNQEMLRRARAQALDNLRHELTRRFGRDSWRSKDLAGFLEKLRARRPFREFLAVHEYWLEKWIARRLD